MQNDVHDADAIRRFFDQWDVYRRVIAHDYMYHRALHGALHEDLSRSVPRGYRLLDLGCGDASVMAHTVAGTGIGAYVGVDLSPVALEHAAANLAAAGVPASFESEDFMAYVRDAPARGFDVVAAGFTVHHLRGTDLGDFFAHARRLIRPGGRLLIYDVFRSENEDLGTYRERSQSWREATWSALSAEELASIRAHTSTADFPTSPSEMAAVAAGAGLPQPDELFVSTVGIHRLYGWSVTG